MTEPAQRADRPRDSSPDQGESAPATPQEATGAAEPAAAALAALAERVEDLARVVARQAATLERMADEARARARRDRADLPLLTELFALHGDTVTCARTAESDRDRTAFTALAGRLERLLTGRGATLVTPGPDTPFDARTMEATDVVDVADPAADRTVEALLSPGLLVEDRSVRPAAVVVRRHRRTT
ncbi:nucleotide exchange factor GrpE [Nocardia farcinica]|uniref:nucleotide exchange factor GrpE n=1 Tax=Nocardia farcinica TaxID=37329 RepID=UPI0018946C7C|nr:nucleotide exchange factor GrpE [Nocardia farcinica]MBF6440870.1 nucleotide exchange factor GrpE [Nocardia farcinica]MBF6524166.1 nucleotide exchange factor GrpE [Nocardia farcinica]